MGGRDGGMGRIGGEVRGREGREMDALPSLVDCDVSLVNRKREKLRDSHAWIQGFYELSISVTG